MGLLYQPDGLGLALCLLDLALALRLGMEDRRLLVRLCVQDRRFLFTLCHENGGFFLSLCPEDAFSPFPFRLHLFFHGFLDRLGRNDVFELHPGHLDAPGIRGLVQHLPHPAIDDLPGGQCLIQIQIADDVSQGGGRQVFDGGNGIDDSVGIELGIRDHEKHHRIDAHGHVILCDHRLRRKIRHLFLQADLFGHPVQEGQQEMQPCFIGAKIGSKTLHHIGVCLGDHPDAGHQKQHQQDDQYDDK